MEPCDLSYLLCAAASLRAARSPRDNGGSREALCFRTQQPYAWNLGAA